MHPAATDALIELLGRVSAGGGDLAAGIADAVRVTEAVLPVDGAAVMLITRTGDFELLGTSTAGAAALEHDQIALGDGPGLECTRRGAVVTVDDLREEPRWRTLAGPHVRAVLAAPIWFLGRPAGNLNALCRRPRAWTREDRQAAMAYAGVVTALLRVAAAGHRQDGLVDALRGSLDGNA